MALLHWFFRAAITSSSGALRFSLNNPCTTLGPNSAAIAAVSLSEAMWENLITFGDRPMWMNPQLEQLYELYWVVSLSMLRRAAS